MNPQPAPKPAQTILIALMEEADRRLAAAGLPAKFRLAIDENKGRIELRIRSIHPRKERRHVD